MRFLKHYVSQGIAANIFNVWWGNEHFVANFVQSLAVKEF